MNIGLYFGSFNPIHTGHLIIANYISNSSHVDQLWFIPSPQNPLKKNETLLNEYHRKYLVEIAIEGEEKLKCNAVEFSLPRPSYTIDTLTYLKEKYSEHNFVIVMGSDSLLNIKRWKNYQLLLSQYKIIIYKRPGFEPTNNLNENENITVLDAPLIEISATDIRKRIKMGNSIRYFVPDIVKEEIEKNNYYR